VLVKRVLCLISCINGVGWFAADLHTNLASKFDLGLLQSQYPNLYPVVKCSLDASRDHASTKLVVGPAATITSAISYPLYRTYR